MFLKHLLRKEKFRKFTSCNADLKSPDVCNYILRERKSVIIREKITVNEDEQHRITSIVIGNYILREGKITVNMKIGDEHLKIQK